MNKTYFKVGDRVEWSRAGEKDHATITDIRNLKDGRQQGHLMVDGWASTGGWEILNHSFKLIEENKK